MIEKHLVADPHAIAHEVARLVVAHPVPGLLAFAFEIVDGESVRLGLHQPVADSFTGHAGVPSSSVARQSINSLSVAM